jgi:hypothetical protein
MFLVVLTGLNSILIALTVVTINRYVASKDRDEAAIR